MLKRSTRLQSEKEEKDWTDSRGRAGASQRAQGSQEEGRGGAAGCPVENRGLSLSVFSLSGFIPARLSLVTVLC